MLSKRREIDLIVITDFCLSDFFSDIWPFPEEVVWVEGWEGEKHRQF